MMFSSFSRIFNLSQKIFSSISLSSKNPLIKFKILYSSGHLKSLSNFGYCSKNVVNRYCGNIIRDYVIIKYRFSINEHLIQIAAVNWDGTKKIIKLELSLYHLNPVIICKSHDVQEKVISVVL